MFGWLKSPLTFIEFGYDEYIRITQTYKEMNQHITIALKLLGIEDRSKHSFF